MSACSLPSSAGLAAPARALSSRGGGSQYLTVLKRPSVLPPPFPPSFELRLISLSQAEPGEGSGSRGLGAARRRQSLEGSWGALGWRDAKRSLEHVWAPHRALRAGDEAVRADATVQPRGAGHPAPPTPGPGPDVSAAALSFIKSRPWYGPANDRGPGRAATASRAPPRPWVPPELAPGHPTGSEVDSWRELPPSLGGNPGGSWN